MPNISNPALIGFLPIIAVVLAWGGYTLFQRWREQRIRARPFPSAWVQILGANQAVYQSLAAQEREQLHTLIMRFLADKTFYGCAGLEITDEMRVTIAAEACLLVLHHRSATLYPDLTSILVYPSAFSAQREQRNEDGTVTRRDQHMLGESWDLGKVVLSWDDVEHGVSDFTDGQNVVLHEFAHQLDAHSGSTNGAPVLRRNSYKSWASVLASNFDDLQRRSERDQPTVMDKYGATNPAEFFAVATETFFEQPAQLHAHRPELFAELHRYYGVDPRQWRATDSSGL